IQSLSYTIDATGMAAHVTSNHPNESWVYGYDDLHRLTSSGSQTFDYDDVESMTYNSLVGTYNHAALPPHAPSAVAGGTMLYDANGSLYSGQARTITWNNRNLPSQINATSFSYDALDSRVKMATGTSSSIYPLGDDYEVTNGVVTKYLSVD